MSEGHDLKTGKTPEGGAPQGGTPESGGRTWYISRRGFLIGMAATGTALALGIPLGIFSMPLVNAFFGLFIGSIQAFVFAMLALTYIAVLRD